MAKRKTVKILDLIEDVNRRNRLSTCGREARLAWNSLLESVLMDAGVYRGFGYLDAFSVPEGEKPGIVRDRNPDYPEKSNCPHIFPDDSRIRFIIDASLTEKGI